MPRPQQHQQQQLLSSQISRLAAGEDELQNQAVEGGEAMEEDVEQEESGHEYFCEVSEEYIMDDFNLTGLNSMVPFWKEAMEMVLDVEPEEDSLKIPDVSIVESSAELLYGLVHQRYILTRAGLQQMAEKYEAGQFGPCSRVYCLGCHVVPCGRSDLPGIDTVKLYCPNCHDIYTPPSSRYQGVDGAFFGTTFAHLFFQSYREFLPAPFYSPSNAASSTRSPTGSQASTSQNFINPNQYGGQKPAAGKVYTPKIYGFRVSERAKSGPRMRWLRLRPENAPELDQVDWRGRWISSDDSDDEFTDDEEEMGPLEDFDADAVGEDDDNEEEEEEEGDENAPNVGGLGTASGRKHHGNITTSSGGQRTLRPPTPIHGSVASSPPASSSLASPQTVSRTRKELATSIAAFTSGKALKGLGGGQRVKVVRNSVGKPT